MVDYIFVFRHNVNAMACCQIIFVIAFEMKSPKELSSLVQQLSHCHHTNKVNVDPFNVIMCGMKGDGRLRELLQSGLFQNDLIPGKSQCNFLLGNYNHNINTHRQKHGHKNLSQSNQNNIHSLHTRHRMLISLVYISQGM